MPPETLRDVVEERHVSFPREIREMETSEKRQMLAANADERQRETIEKETYETNVKVEIEKDKKPKS